MNRYGIGGLIQPPRWIVIRIKIVCRQYFSPCKVLPLPIQLQSKGEQRLCVKHGAAHFGICSILQRLQLQILLPHCQNRGMIRLRAKSQSSVNIPIVFKAVKRLVLQQLIRSPDLLHICVKIEASLLRHDRKPDKIT